MTGTHLFPERTYRELFGIKKAKDIEYVDGLIGALEKIDRALLPAPAAHPLSGLIGGGLASVDELVAKVEGSDEQAALDAIDALAHIFLYAGVPESAAVRLRKAMSRAGGSEKNPEKVALLAKCLAIGGDEELLTQQLTLLADDDPGVVASAARLLGLGRFRPAVPALRALVSPDRLYESRMVIWTLGEIGDRAALYELEYALASGFRSVDCMIAMGKIGELTSIPKLTPMAISGLPEQRDAAWRAIAMILDQNRELAQGAEPLVKELTGLIEHQLADDGLDKSGSLRFHLCLCLARLGHTLDVARVKKILNIQLDESEATEMAGFFMRKGR